MLVSFITEITSTGDKHKDFKLFLKALNVLRHCGIGGGKFQGVHFDQNHEDGEEPCVVPFFGYNNTHQHVSPILPEVETPNGVARWFGGYGSIVTNDHNVANIMGTYHLPMKPVKIKGEEVQITATIDICSMACRTELKHVLSKLDEVAPATA